MGQVGALQVVAVERPVVVAVVATFVGFLVSLGCRNPKVEMTLRVFSSESQLFSHPVVDQVIYLGFLIGISLIV